MADGDLMDLQEVLNALSIGEQDLQNMVAQGKLKAVRAGRTVKFRRAEVMSMKGGRSTEPTIIIPSKGAPTGRKIDESAATVVPEAPAGGVVPVDTQEISIEDEELEILPLEDEAAATQAEAPVAGEELTVAEEAAPAEEAAVEGVRSSGRRSSRVGSRRSGAVYIEQESPIWTGMLVGTLVILLVVSWMFGTMLLYNYWDDVKGTKFLPPGPTQMAFDIFSDKQQ